MSSGRTLLGRFLAVFPLIAALSGPNRTLLLVKSVEEKGILEAYEYNTENNLALDPSIQKFENGEVYLYTKAIKIPNGMCLNCHGEPGTDISAETQKALAELYPEDKAIGHKIGDLRGMWSIRIPKKEVVKKM